MRARRSWGLVAVLVAALAQPVAPAAASVYWFQPAEVSAPSITATPNPTSTGAPTDLPTFTDTPTPGLSSGIPTLPVTDTPTPPVTGTPTPPVTDTPTPPVTGTPTPPVTDTPTPPVTDTPTPPVTDTPTPPVTGTPTPPVSSPPTNRRTHRPSGTRAGAAVPHRKSTPRAGVRVPKPPRPHPHKSLRPHPHKSLRPHPHQVAGVSRPHPHRKPWPITLTVKAVPALAGVSFTLDGHQFATGADGVATYTAEHDFAGHRLSVLSSSVTGPSRRYEFERWAGQRDPNQAYSRTVSGLPLRSNYEITAAFTVQQQVLPRLIRQDGTPLDSTEVSAITARSDSGETVSLPLTGPTWLDGVRPAYHHSVLSAEPVSYSLQSVLVRGTNVVDSGRQSFRPSTTANPTFTTQFHDLVITGHDALFKMGRGTRAVVTFPDGGKLTVPLNSQHTATLSNLPRGNYRVGIEAGTAIVGVQQFSLSRNKTADLTVISALDLTVLLGVLLVIAVGLLLIGRPYWRRLAGRSTRTGAVGPREKILI